MFSGLLARRPTGDGNLNGSLSGVRLHYSDFRRRGQALLSKQMEYWGN